MQFFSVFTQLSGSRIFGTGPIRVRGDIDPNAAPDPIPELYIDEKVTIFLNLVG